MRTQLQTIRYTLRCGFAFLCAGLLLQSCDTEKLASPDETSTGEVHFNTPDIVPMQTRVSGTAWGENDKVGIYMKNAGSSLSGPGQIVEGGDNKEYHAAANGKLTPAEGGLYYPLNGDRVDFIAYHPYSKSIAGYAFKADFAANQDKPEVIDLIYSDNASDKNAEAPNITLFFKHQFTKLTMNLIKGVGLADADLSAISIRIKGFPASVSFDLGTKAITAGKDGDITPKTVTAGELYTAIIPPHNTAGRTVEFLLDGTTFTWEIPDNVVLASGKNHRYNITINKLNTISIEVASAGIADWTTDGPAEDATISQKRGVEFVTIPAGSFTMGSPQEYGNANERPRHEVTLTKSFRMSRYLITNSQFAEFMNARKVGSNAKYAEGLYPEKALVKSGTWVGVRWNVNTLRWEPEQQVNSEWPVINVNWYGATEFARWMGGRLPTEAEWEYACRAGTATKYYTGDQINVDGIQANVEGVILPGRTEKKQYIVGFLPANPWGLYDMIGSVLEWTSDYWYDYAEGAVTDPSHTTPAANAVCKGSAWWISAKESGCAARWSKSTDTMSDSMGFRIVLPE